MKRIRKQYFNMVEIILAVVVLAVGMTGVFVLFPVGLKSHGNAKGENTVADLAEYLMAFVRAEVSLNAINPARVTNNSGDKGNTTKRAYYFDLNQLATAKIFASSNDEITDAIDVDNVEDEWENLSTESTAISKASLLKYQKNPKNKKTAKPGFFLIRQMAGPDGNIVDFSAVAKIWLDNQNDDSGFENEYFPTVTRNAGGGTDKEYRSKYSEIKKTDISINDFLLPVMLEISWPATLPYDQREKRFFRFEIFNEEYEQRVQQ